MSQLDPFEAGQREAIRSTDELLDRIGARAPTPEDLDDPLVAALALMAAEIDLDAVPVESTRGALDRALPGFRLGLGRAPGAPAAAEEAAAVLDLRNARDREAVDVLGSGPAAAGTRWSRNDASRGPRRSGRHPEHAAVAMAPPRSLPRVASPPGRPGGQGTRPDGRRERRLRPLTAVAVAIAAIVLGGGVTAAVTGGRYVNPLTGLPLVVAELTNGRTLDQQQLFDADVRRIDVARSSARQGDQAGAMHQLNRVRTDGLSDEDNKHIVRLEQEVLKLLGDR
jgi:hypothetical protein